MKAQYSVSGDVMRLMGRKLYQKKPLTIGIRELLQNSRDACIRAGVDPKIIISIVYNHLKDRTIYLKVSDNGCGMDEEVLMGGYLCLGGTTKNDGSTGGLGIGTASILSSKAWSIHTHDLLVTSTMLEANEEVQHVDWIDGTVVSVEIDTTDEGYSRWSLAEALGMIYFSNVEIDLTVDWNGQWGDHTLFHEDKAGMDSFATKLAAVQSGQGWVLYGENSALNQTNMFTEGYWHGAGLSVVRMGGLVQYYSTTTMGRTNNLFFDLAPSDPRSKEWPLNASREQLQGTVSNDYIDLMAKHDSSPLTSRTNVAVAQITASHPEDSPVKVIKGSLVHGTHNLRRQHESSGVRGLTPVTALRMGPIQKAQDVDKLIKAGKMQLLLYYYKGEPNEEIRAWQVRLMHAWSTMVTLVAPPEEEFGFGITSLDGTVAQRHFEDGVLYYTINPSYFDRQMSIQAQALSLWCIAAHEVSHGKESNHTESFTSLHDELLMETSDVVMDQLPRVVKQLAE